MEVSLGPNVAVLEDQVEVGQTVVESLNEDGIIANFYHIRTPEDLESAIDQIKIDQPKLIMVDQRMGLVTGEQAIRRIREIPGINRTWIVLASGQEAQETQKVAALSGADSILIKPWEWETLVRTVRHGLGRTNQLLSDPTTGIPGVEATNLILPLVFRLETPWAVLSTDWNGYGGLIEVGGADLAEQTLKKVLDRWVGILSWNEKEQYRFIGQLGKSDGAIIVCRAENAAVIGEALVESFHEELKQAYLSIKGGEAILKRGFAIRTRTVVGENREEVSVQEKIPNATLAIGINSNVWFKGFKEGPLSFAADDPKAWEFEPVRDAPRPMFYPRLVRRLADVARLEAERLSKVDPVRRKSWVVVHEGNPWFELSGQEQEEWRRTHPRLKLREGRLVEVFDLEEAEG